SRISRRSAESWLGRLLSSVRRGKLNVAPHTALHIVASHLDDNGEVLDPRIAAVELLNLLLPVVAVSVYIVWCAHALTSYSLVRERLMQGDDRYLSWFLQEVRRYYPFFPAVTARVRHDFEWNGFHFPKGQRALLDLYGTNHDSRTWSLPGQF